MRDKIYIILGMKRSGHHALVYWIGENIINCSHYNDYRISKEHKKFFSKSNKESNRTKFGTGGNNNVIINIEDFDPKWFNVCNFKEILPIPKYKKCYILLIIRDPFNWLASSMKMGGGPRRRIANRIKMYKDYFRYISEEKIHPENLFIVSYNEWFSDPEYRANLALHLDLPSCDKGVNKVSPRGGGSSFDKMKLRNKAQSMKVLERWKEMKSDPEYIKMIDMDLCKISTKFFNMKIGLK